MSGIPSILKTLHGNTIQQRAQVDKAWCLIGPKSEFTGLPCRRLYSCNGKDYDVALYFVRGKFFAINAKCPHMGGPLDVIVDLEELMDMDEPHTLCPWHLYAYNLNTGISPQGLKVETHKTKIENGNLFVFHEHELSVEPFETDID